MDIIRIIKLIVVIGGVESELFGLCTCVYQQSFVKQPADVVAKEGDDVHFTCTVSYFNHLADSIFWVVDPPSPMTIMSRSFNPMTMEMTSTIAFDNIGRKEHSQMCVYKAWDSKYPLYSRVAKLSVQFFPRNDEIQCGPENITYAHEGDDVSLWCQINRSEAPVNISLQIDAQDIHPLEKYSYVNETMVVANLSSSRFVNTTSAGCVATMESVFPGKRVLCNIGPIKIRHSPQKVQQEEDFSIYSTNNTTVEIMSCDIDGYSGNKNACINLHIKTCHSGGRSRNKNQSTVHAVAAESALPTNNLVRYYEEISENMTVISILERNENDSFSFRAVECQNISITIVSMTAMNITFNGQFFSLLCTDKGTSMTDRRGRLIAHFSNICFKSICANISENCSQSPYEYLILTNFTQKHFGKGFLCEYDTGNRCIAKHSVYNTQSVVNVINDQTSTMNSTTKTRTSASSRLDETDVILQKDSVMETPKAANQVEPRTEIYFIVGIVLTVCLAIIISIVVIKVCRRGTEILNTQSNTAQSPCHKCVSPNDTSMTFPFHDPIYEDPQTLSAPRYELQIYAEYCERRSGDLNISKTNSDITTCLEGSESSRASGLFTSQKSEISSSSQDGSHTFGETTDSDNGSIHCYANGKAFRVHLGQQSAASCQVLSPMLGEMFPRPPPLPSRKC